MTFAIWPNLAILQASVKQANSGKLVYFGDVFVFLSLVSLVLLQGRTATYSDNISTQKIDLPLAGTVCFLGLGTMRIKNIKAWIVIVALFVTVVVIFVVFSANERQLQKKRVSHIKYPCIVLKVDNSGCQTEIEMRTHVAVTAN